MDLLPYPVDPCQPPLQFEFICGDVLEEQKANGVFGNFSWDAWIEQVDICKTMLMDEGGARHIQAHVYFGYLRGIVGSSFNPADFVRDGRFLSLARLREYIPGPRDVSRDLHTGLDLRRLETFTRSIPIDLCLSASPASTIEVLISIDALQYSIALAQPSWAFEPSRPSTSLIAIPLLKERLNRSGWCPYWSNLWVNKFSIALLHYVSGVKPPTGDSRNKGKSVACTVTQCYCNSVDFKSYQPQHSASCGSIGCHFTGVDAEHLSRIVNDGGVPLIKLSRKPTPANQPSEVAHLEQSSRHSYLENATWESDGYTYDFDIVDHDVSIRFVAISHVWSGGLGNFTANTVPRCQLEYLYQQVDECRKRGFDESRVQGGHLSWEAVETEPINELMSILPNLSFLKNYLPASKVGPVYIWFDALCIPFDNGTLERAETKQNAIDSMRFVYSSAAHILVIDPILRTSAVERETELSVAIKITTSSWLTRVWTFQEGFLARELSFSLKDKCINPKIWSLTVGRRRKGMKIPESALFRLDCLWSQCESTEELALTSEALEAITGQPQVADEQSLAQEREGDLMEDFVEGVMYWVEAAWEYIRINFLRHEEDDPSTCRIISYNDPEIKMFCNLWNEMSERKTTMSADLRGILAIGIGVRPGATVCMDEYGRRHGFREMKILLRGLPGLPFEMLTKPFPLAADLCPTERWIPSLPTGRLHHEPSMFWVKDGTGLCLPQVSPAYLIDDESLGLLPEGILNITVGDSKILEIRLLNIPEDLEFRGNQFCVVFKHRVTPQNRDDTGALFIVKRQTTSAIFLQFCAPLVYSPVSGGGNSPVTASELPADTRRILSCDSQEWPSPKQATKLGKSSAISFASIASPLISLYWYLGIWPNIHYSGTVWYQMQIETYNFIEDHMREAPRFIRTTIHAFRLITIWLILCFVIIAPTVLRLLAFEILEGSFIEYKIAEARRRHFAKNSIQGSPRKSKVKQKPWYKRGNFKFRLYQYSTLLSIATPLIAAGIMYGTGYWLVARGPHGNWLLQACHYLIGIPLECMAVALYFEVLIRVTGELIFRFPWMKVVRAVKWPVVMSRRWAQSKGRGNIYLPTEM